MLLPALNKARTSARTVSCLNNQKQLAQLMTNYNDDNNGYYVNASQFIRYTLYRLSWAGKLYAGYLAHGNETAARDAISGKSSIVRCPEYTQAVAAEWQLNRTDGWAIREANGWTSYGLNAGVLSAMAYKSGSWNFQTLLEEPGKPGGKLLSQPSATIMSGDTKDKYSTFFPFPGGTGGVPRILHGGKIVFSYLDGHTEAVPTNTLGPLDIDGKLPNSEMKCNTAKSWLGQRLGIDRNK